MQTQGPLTNDQACQIKIQSRVMRGYTHFPKKHRGLVHSRRLL